MCVLSNKIKFYYSTPIITIIIDEEHAYRQVPRTVPELLMNAHRGGLEVAG